MNRRSRSTDSVLNAAHAAKPASAATVTRWPLGAALAAVFLGAIDLTVIATVLPRIVLDLEINTADVDRYIWIVNAYLLAYIVAIPMMGRLSDLLGRGTAFQLALMVFLAGSLWSAFADNLRALIFARALQGAGGGALLPVTMALVGDLLPPGRRLAALGLVGAVDTLGWVLGPLWGAAVVGLLGGRAEPWRWVFLVNIPLGVAIAIGIAVTDRRPSRSRRAERRVVGRIDVLGTVLLGGALLLLNLALSSGGEIGISGESAMRALGGTRNPLSHYLLPFLVGGLALLAGLAVWERRAANPVLPPHLFRRQAFAAAIGANFVVGATLIVAMVDVPVLVALLVAQDRIGTVTALVLAPFTIMIALLAFAGGVIASRLGERRTAAAGLLLVIAGYVAMWVGLDGRGYPSMLPGLVVAGTGFGLVVAPIGASVIDAAPAADRGIAAALTILFRLLGMTTGISALTAIGIRRLQLLSERVAPVMREPNETTADFLVRQTQYIADHAIPLSIQVIRETFLLAAGLAVLALIPVYLMRSGNPVATDAAPPPAMAENSEERRSQAGTHQ